MLSLEECQDLVKRVWVSYCGPEWSKSVPLVKDGRGRRRAAYHSYDHSIRMPKWSRQAGMVVHEVAHAVMHMKVEDYPKSIVLGNKFAAHGPEFVRVHCELLVAFLGWDPKVLIEGLTTGKRNVKIIPGNKLPNRIRARKAHKAKEPYEIPRKRKAA